MKAVQLPQPRLKGAVSVEEAIQERRSVRSYSRKDISLEDVSQLLWACQGITDKRRGLRSSPSAGALYPLEVYVAKSDGLFRYLSESHSLEVILDKDVRKELADAAHDQNYAADAAIDIIIAAVYGRITSKYGDRGIRYTDIEAGHAAQNVFLQASALGLCSVPIGAFNDPAVSKILKLPNDVTPLYILPVGHKK